MLMRRVKLWKYVQNVTTYSCFFLFWKNVTVGMSELTSYTPRFKHILWMYAIKCMTAQSESIKIFILLIDMPEVYLVDLCLAVSV